MPLESKLQQLPENVWLTALVFLLLLLALWLGMGWFWYFREAESAPSPAVVPDRVDLQTAVNTISAQHLFGKPITATGAPAPKVEAPPKDIKLRGVFAATGVKPAYAILSIEGGADEAVKVGDELEDGLVLKEVHPGHVVLSRGETQHEIVLETGIARAQPAVAGAPRTQPQNPVATPRPVQQGAGSRVASGSATGKGAADSAPKPEAGPAVINPAAGFKIDAVPQDLQKLGLKKGDVVSQINGQVVTSHDDLTRLYQQFSPLGQVIVEGTRDGKPLRLSTGS